MSPGRLSRRISHEEHIYISIYIYIYIYIHIYILSRPDSVVDFEVKVLKTFEGIPFSEKAHIESQSQCGAPLRLRGESGPLMA